MAWTHLSSISFWCCLLGKPRPVVGLREVEKAMDNWTGIVPPLQSFKKKYNFLLKVKTNGYLRKRIGSSIRRKISATKAKAQGDV